MEGSGIFILFAISFVIFIIIMKGVKIVPQQEAWIVENLGRFEKVLGSALIN